MQPFVLTVLLILLPNVLFILTFVYSALWLPVYEKCLKNKLYFYFISPITCVCCSAWACSVSSYCCGAVSCCWCMLAGSLASCVIGTVGCQCNTTVMGNPPSSFRLSVSTEQVVFILTIIVLHVCFTCSFSSSVFPLLLSLLSEHDRSQHFTELK